MKEGVPKREEDKTEKELSNLERLVEYEKQGDVYVFNKEPFTLKRHWYVKSKESVKPIDKIEVEFKDFEKLGGVIEWKEGGNIKGTED
jgi:hypothetical protein